MISRVRAQATGDHALREQNVWYPNGRMQLPKRRNQTSYSPAARCGALKERERDDRDDEIARLKSKVGEITMDNELLYAKIEALEGKRPLAHRRSRR